MDAMQFLQEVLEYVEKDRPRFIRALRIADLFLEYREKLAELSPSTDNPQVLNQVSFEKLRSRIGVPVEQVFAVLCCITERMTPLLSTAETVPGTLPEGVRRALRRLVDDPSVLAVLLYGSRARGDARPDSDWDFLALFREGTDGSKQREAALEAQDLTAEDWAFFLPYEARCDRLDMVFAEEVLLSGKLVHWTTGFLRDAPWFVSEDFFEPFLDSETRRLAAVYEIESGLYSFSVALEQVTKALKFRRSWWPPFGMDLVFQDLKRAVRRPAAGLAFWLRPLFLKRGIILTPGRPRELLRTLAKEGHVPPWSLALFEVIDDYRKGYDWDETLQGEDRPFLPPGCLFQIYTRVKEYLEFVFQKNGLGKIKMERLAESLRFSFQPCPE